MKRHRTEGQGWSRAKGQLTRQLHLTLPARSRLLLDHSAMMAFQNTPLPRLTCPYIVRRVNVEWSFPAFVYFLTARGPIVLAKLANSHVSPCSPPPSFSLLYVRYMYTYHHISQFPVQLLLSFSPPVSPTSSRAFLSSNFRHSCSVIVHPPAVATCDYGFFLAPIS